MSPLANRSIVITGGTGSFGRAFARHALDVGASRVAIFSRDWLKQSEMTAAYSDPRMRWMLGSVEDLERLKVAFNGADIVIHAAAAKEIKSCEEAVEASTRTNFTGSANVTKAAIHCGVERAILLSTDKAASPATAYGCQKLLAEREWTQANVLAAGTSTRFIATRYGNVIGSRGSVVERWRAAAKESGRIIVTDPDATRFWMPLHHAVCFVEMAIRDGRGGEVFIPKLGSASVATLAEAVVPGVPRETVGLTRNEKLHEELFSDTEARYTYDCGTHFRLECERSWEYLPPNGYPLVDGGAYRSDTNQRQLDIQELRIMVD